jgi:hypothetical protein
LGQAKRDPTSTDRHCPVGFAPLNPTYDRRKLRAPDFPSAPVVLSSAMSDPKNVIIAVLVAAVVVLGYLYYDSQRNRVSINLPGVKIEAK